VACAVKRVVDESGRRGVGLGGDPSLGAFQAGGNADVLLALVVGLGPDLDGGRDLGRIAGGVFCGFGLGGFGWPGWGGLGAGLLALFEAALSFVGCAVEADSIAAEAEDAGQREVWRRGLTGRFKRMEAEADDLGGEPQFLRGVRVVVGEHFGRGKACGGEVAAGAGEEEGGEPDQDGFQNGGRERVGEGHGAARDVRCMF
jgi:hypothetical protein